MIDYDKFKYRIGDKIRRIGNTAEYEITNIQSMGAYGSTYNHYRLRNTSAGCTDNPQWISQSIVHRSYEPCNPAIKVLFNKKENPNQFTGRLGSPDGLLVDTKTLDAYRKILDGSKLMVTSGRRSGKTQTMLESLKNRAEPGTGDHLTDALVYGIGYRKVSR